MSTDSEEELIGFYSRLEHVTGRLCQYACQLPDVDPTRGVQIFQPTDHCRAVGEKSSNRNRQCVAVPCCNAHAVERVAWVGDHVVLSSHMTAGGFSLDYGD